METRLLIRGEQVPGEGEPLAVENPATEETLVELMPASGTARRRDRGRDRGVPVWAGTPAVERAAPARGARMRASTDELAHHDARGRQALLENSDEVGWTAAAFDYYAEMGRNFAGRVIRRSSPPSSRSL